MKRKIITNGNWWDKLGKPEYGGEIVIRADRNIVFRNLANIDSAWLEKLHTDDWTLDPAVFDYKTCWRPSQYLKGQLAESWEFTAPILVSFICVREFTGKIYRRQTDGSSSLMMWCFTLTGCAAWVGALRSRVRNAPHRWRS